MNTQANITANELPAHIISYLSEFKDGTAQKITLEILFSGQYVARDCELLSKRSNAVHSIVSTIKNEFFIPVFGRKVKGSEMKEYFIPKGFLINMLKSRDDMDAVIEAYKGEIELKRLERAKKQYEKSKARLAKCGISV